MYFSDIWAELKGDGIALDRTEAALIGAPEGETVSLYAAMSARHGAVLARIACAVFSVLIQRGHCAAQISRQRPMSAQNYLRAFACLLVPVFALCALLRWIL